MGGPGPGDDDRTDPPSRLARRLGLGDAVVIGLGAMVGAGIFAALGPAAEAAGSGLLIGLAIAGAVAYCNATSTAQLAARHPEAGGVYAYGRARLGHGWGFLAGWCFLVGKTASCAAMALTFGVYAAPEHTRWLAVAAVVALAAVNLAGVTKTAALTRALVVAVLTTLAVVVGASGTVDGAAGGVGSVTDQGFGAILESAGILFFAFAGYARIATLGEEVREPRTVIPRAVTIALGITLVLYAVVAASALVAVGPVALAADPAPLTAVTDASAWPWATAVVRGGAVLASLSVLLSLLVGLSRTTFAMAAGGDLPRFLAAVHPGRAVPHRAEVAVALLVVAVVATVDLRGAIGFSSFAVLTYYLVANASAFRLGPSERLWPRALTVLGAAGCVMLAAALPRSSVLAGLGLVAAGLLTWWVRRAARGISGSQ